VTTIAPRFVDGMQVVPGLDASCMNALTIYYQFQFMYTMYLHLAPSHGRRLFPEVPKKLANQPG
jgi:hypothetical protein